MTKIIFPKEQALYLDELANFWGYYLDILDASEGIALRRGKTFDTDPLHHRWEPEGFVHEVFKKIDRIRSAMQKPDWAMDRDTLAVITREAPDIINYAAYLWALTQQIMDSLNVEERIVDPELPTGKK